MVSQEHISEESGNESVEVVRTQEEIDAAELARTEYMHELMQPPTTKKIFDPEKLQQQYADADALEETRSKLGTLARLKEFFVGELPPDMYLGETINVGGAKFKDGALVNIAPGQIEEARREMNLGLGLNSAHEELSAKEYAHYQDLCLQIENLHVEPGTRIDLEDAHGKKIVQNALYVGIDQNCVYGRTWTPGGLSNSRWEVEAFEMSDVARVVLTPPEFQKGMA